MARRGSGGGGMGGTGMLAPVLSIAVGLIVFIVLITFAPTIAGSVENTQNPANWTEMCRLGDPAGGTASLLDQESCKEHPGANVTVHDEWLNTTYNTDMPNGVDQWTTNIQILGVVILIISISVAMYFLKGMA